MMSDELKAILKRPEAGRTDEEKVVVKAALEAYRKDVIEVCEKHGLQDRGTLQFSTAGITPTLEVILYEKAPEETSAPAA